MYPIEQSHFFECTSKKKCAKPRRDATWLTHEAIA